MTTSQASALSRRLLSWSALSALLASCLHLATTDALAQSSRSSGGSGRDYAIALPLALNGESVAKLEKNLGGQVSLSLEIQTKRKRDEIDEEKALETKESMVTSARGAALIVSRYSVPNRLAGFYWSLGAGYRQMNADWRVRPDAKDKNVDLSLVDADNTLHHRATLSGVTAHGRVGYRYVADEMPLMIGAYFGLRHFQAGVKEEAGGSSSEGTSDAPVYAEMTSQEQERLKRRYMTRPEPAIELGFVF